MINVIQLKKQVRSRSTQKLFLAPPIGSAIKFKRRELHLTLEEGSEGICSVSYLSKLENSQIEASEKFIDALLDRFQISELNPDNIRQYEEDKNELIDAMIYRLIPRHDMLDFYGDRVDYQAQIIHLIYNLTVGAYDKADSFYATLKAYIIRLQDQELALLLLYAAIRLYHKKRYSDAYDILVLMTRHVNDIECIELLVTCWRLRSALRMHKAAEIEKLMPKVMQLCIEHQTYDQLSELRFKYIQFEATFQPIEYIENRVQTTPTLDVAKKEYLLGVSKYYHQDYLYVIEQAKPYWKVCKYWYLLYLSALDQLEEQEKIIQALTHPIHLGDSLEIRRMMHHFKCKYGLEKSKVVNYLKTEIITKGHITDSYIVLDYLMMDTQQILSQYHHYKDAVQIFTQTIPKLKQLSKSFNQ